MKEENTYTCVEIFVIICYNARSYNIGSHAITSSSSSSLYFFNKNFFLFFRINACIIWSISNVWFHVLQLDFYFDDELDYDGWSDSDDEFYSADDEFDFDDELKQHFEFARARKKVE